MKITIKGDTPMERLTNLTKLVIAVPVIAVPKDEVEREEQKWRKDK